MITPRFKLSQTDDEVMITVYAHFTNIKNTEVYVEGKDFRFFSDPYYLRLNLPGDIEENDASVGNYDCEKGEFHMKFSKVNKGEHFENLDMITTLLQPPKKKKNKMLNVEVISNPAASSEIKDNEELKDEETEPEEWFYPQTVSREDFDVFLLPPKYGFANKLSKALDFESEWLAEIIDLPQPDETPATLRKSLREKNEVEFFNEHHYKVEFIEDEEINECISFDAEWETLKVDQVAFSEEDIDVLKELPNKEYLLDTQELQWVKLGMVDILFGCCYDNRTTYGESTVESGWTISKLSSTLSWFETFTEPKELFISCVRRSLCFPLYRNWNLSMKVIEDVKQTLKLGKKYIIKQFCKIHRIFNRSHTPKYVLNQLYINDYLIWLQQAPVAMFEKFEEEFREVTVSKEEVGLDLIKHENSIFDDYKDCVIENTATECVDLSTYFKRLTMNEEPIFSFTSSSSDESDSDSDSNSDSTSSSSNSDSSSDSLDSDDLSDGDVNEKK